MGKYEDIFKEENIALQEIVENCNYEELGYKTKDEFLSAVTDAHISGIPVMDPDDYERSLKAALDDLDEEYHSLPEDRELRSIEWRATNEFDQSFIEDLCECWYPLSKELENGEIVSTGLAVNYDTGEIDTVKNLGKRICAIRVSVEFDTYRVVDKGFSKEYGWNEDAESRRVQREIASEIDLEYLLEEEYKKENEEYLDEEVELFTKEYDSL